MPKKKPLRRITMAKVSHISLCPKGASTLPTLFKADDPSFQDIKEQLEGIIKGARAMPDDSFVRIRDVFPRTSTVVYEVGGVSWKVGYNLSEGTLVGEPTEVAERTIYFEVDALMKSDPMEDEGIVLGVMYAPELKDSQGDFADADTIKTIMYDFAKSGKGVDINHDFETLTKDDAYVAESFIIQPNDKRFDDFKNYEGEVVDVTGGWGVCIKIDNEDLRQKYRDGEWAGLSMGGSYQAEPVEEDEMSLVKCYKMLKNYFGKNKNNEEEEIDMKPEELAKVVQDSVVAAVKPFETSLTGVTDRLEKLEKASTPEEEEVPELDLTKASDVAARILELKKEEMKNSVDVTDTASLEAHLEVLKSLEKSSAKPKPTQPVVLSKSDEESRKTLVEDLRKMGGFNKKETS